MPDVREIMAQWRHPPDFRDDSEKRRDADIQIANYALWKLKWPEYKPIHWREFSTRQVFAVEYARFLVDKLGFSEPVAGIIFRHWWQEAVRG